MHPNCTAVVRTEGPGPHQSAIGGNPLHHAAGPAAAQKDAHRIATTETPEIAGVAGQAPSGRCSGPADHLSAGLKGSHQG